MDKSRNGLKSKSKTKEHRQDSPKNTEHRKKYDDLKSFRVNGVNYFSHEKCIDKKAQVLNDVYTAKGDYFYLKKG